MNDTSAAGHREKRTVALTSVAAAVVLTAGKLVVGLLTGSLGILSEALHSALDLVAAVVTFFAVKASARPADERHVYGHGKVENLSALFETVLLLVTCVWILVEAVERLVGKPHEVDASWAAFAVMAASIVIDLSRSRALARVARKYHSQALEADALHFSTDVWSSTVVLAGLLLVRVSDLVGAPWLQMADALAALGVAGIVIWVSLKLGRRSIGDLLDEAPSGLKEQIEQACDVDGVVEVLQTRVRQAGPQTFVDLTVRVAEGMSLHDGHDLAHRVEHEVLRVSPGADVVVHVEPPSRAGLPVEVSPVAVRRLAAEHGLDVHNVRIVDLESATQVELHLEVEAELNVTAGHGIATAFEVALKQAFPSVSQVVSHIEPRGTHRVTAHVAPDAPEIEALVRDLVASDPTALGYTHLSVRRHGSRTSLSFTCHVPPTLTVAEAHRVAERLERAVRAGLAEPGRVCIHVEPSDTPRDHANGAAI
jgi:cation diffusion facilitator family transporter